MLEMVSRKHFTVKYLLLHRDTLTLNSSSEDQLYNTDRGRAVVVLVVGEGAWGH